MESEVALRRMEALRAGSRTLTEFVERDARAQALLEEGGPLPGRARYVEAVGRACRKQGAAGLRLERRRWLADLAARDLAGELDLTEVGEALADLADACLDAALAEVGAPDALCVIGMGKLGGRELNYCSDIDIVFVAGGDPAACTKSAEALLRVLGGHSPEGQAYRIDTNLRPEGRSGALVRSAEGYHEYYRRWAHPWEFQALIKARPCAGTTEVGGRVLQQIKELVYPAKVPPERVIGIRKTKERVEEHAQRAVRVGRSPESDDVKLGPGGIRDIEFSVQLLQLVHGGGDPSVRSPTTLEALQSLVAGGYVAEDDGAGLAVAYRWLRTVEHRLQMWQERRVHRLPPPGRERARIARVMGFHDAPDASAPARFDAKHKAVLADVRRRFEKLFYRPMIEALAEGAGPRLSPEGLRERLRVFGFRDVDRAARTLNGLVAGTSRRATLLRVLTPAMLRWLAGSPLPDEGLFSFLRLSEAVRERLDTLGALRDNPPGLRELARVLGSGRLLGEWLEHVPDELLTIADRAGPGPATNRDALIREARASLDWRSPEQRLDGLRRFKRRAMLRVALGDLTAGAGVEATGAALADLADACLEAALGDVELPFAVIGMGKLGGRELNYSSDLDVMFVHDGDPMAAEEIAEDLLAAIGGVTPEGQAFRIDPGLRPEGRSGPLARSLESFSEYYTRWSKPWEHQALIKARPSAGDEDLGRRFLELARPLAFPQRLPSEALAEMRHLKARMERERVPRGVDPRRHIKMGPGGLADIDFAAQILQRRHGAGIETLRCRATLDALAAASDAGLVSADAADRLSEAFRFLMALRNRLYFIAGRPVDVLPTKPEDLEALGIAMGFREQPRQELEESYLRITRRSRRAAEPLIFG